MFSLSQFSKHGVPELSGNPGQYTNYALQIMSRKARSRLSRAKPGSLRTNQDQKTPRLRRFTNVWIYLFLFAATLLLYAKVLGFDFVEYDDPDYSGKALALGGFTSAGVRWAITSTEALNWFPLTRLSHLADVQLFGAQSGLHHLSSVIFHAFAAVFLFTFLYSCTGARWRAVLVASLFVIHPLHVESVAWVAERKDVLCGLFSFLALWLYVRYAQAPSAHRYLPVLFTFSLGLMSKPMIVTLPFVLLLLDVWPLARVRWNSDTGAVPLRKAILEKVPLLLLSAVVSCVAYLTQKPSGYTELIHFPLSLRIENALTTYVLYIWQTVWPTKLAVLYPYPPHIPIWQPILAAILLAAAVSFAVLRSFRTRPYLATGWFWYLGTLVPVIGLVQIGVHGHADRYMYIPMVGLLIMLAWGLAEVAERWPRGKPFVIGMAVAACACCAVLTSAQLDTWRNSEALYRHAINETQGNVIMHYGLGVVLAKDPNRLDEAIAEYQAAVRDFPNYLEARGNLGNALLQARRLPEAIAEDQAALRLKPDSAQLHNNLGVALARTPGQMSEAISEYRAALRLQPNFLQAHTNLADALATTPGHNAEAIAEYRAALRFDASSAETHNKLAALLASSRRTTDSIAEYQAALRLKPDSIEAHNGLASVLAQLPGRIPEAISVYQAALRIKPDSAELHNNLGALLAKSPDHVPEAISEYEAALRIKPDFFEAHVNLGMLLSTLPGRSSDAAVQFEAALRIRPDPTVRQMLENTRVSR